MVITPPQVEFEDNFDSRLSDLEVLNAISNNVGSIRLRGVRDFIPKPLQSDVGFLTGTYFKWVTSPEALILRGENVETSEIKMIGVKCSKRGNDIFNRRIDRKLSFLKELKQRGIEFFRYEDFKLDKVVKTSLLWVTLTWDSKLCSLHEAWKRAEHDFNLWITNLRNRYGKIRALKFIQAFPDPSGKAYGYPHFHIVLLFESSKFGVYPHMEQDKNGKMVMRYRVNEKSEIADKSNWHSWIDVQALRTFKAVSGYCRKYAQGTYEVVSSEGIVNKEALLNCTMGWFYRKQSYSLSGGFREEFADLIKAHMQGSKGFQSRLDGSEGYSVWVWESKGVRSWAELRKVGLDPPNDVFDIEDKDVFDRLVKRNYRGWNN